VTQIKICGLTRFGDAQAAVELGADFLGFVFEPSSPRYVGDPAWSPAWLADLGALKVAVFGIASHAPPKAFDCVQAHTWPVEFDTQRIHVIRTGSPEAATMIDPEIRTIIVDSFHLSSHGGTGLTADWDAASRVIESANAHVILAGGLNPDNVGHAIRTVRPWGVDVSSGIESAPGIKDHGLITAFVAAVREADASLQSENQRS
jgi:phosphoribosylanthranilate isomerase